MTNELTAMDFQSLQDDIQEGLEAWSLDTYKQEPRTHLGISEIGEPCARKLWYKFRWVAFEHFDGRMLRLFQYGHQAEERYINYLEGIGFKYYRFQNGILNYHPESDSLFLSTDGLVEDVTGYPQFEARAKAEGLERKQWRVSGVLGHYGGSTDGVAVVPKYPANPLLVEFKSHNTKSFVHLVEHGLIKSKPKHYDQMCGYGEKLQIHYGLYFAENKNDNDIYTEIVRLDWQRGYQLERKAEEIIKAIEPPVKISESPAYFDCKFCFARDICHHEAIPAKNCRSCRMCEPIDNAEWFCHVHKSNIPKEFIPIGCDNWAPI